MIGQIVSHYKILKQLGIGGMGIVYEAEDLKLKRHVALKFMPPHIASNPDSLKRFKREAEAASSLNHPNICTIYDIDDHEGATFIAMELLEGSTLREKINGQTLSEQELLRYAIQLTNALDAAHAKGIIHRDIKPSNIFITQRDELKLLDFGLAKVQVEEVFVGGMEGPTRSISDRLTGAGVTMGTIGYMSPEQLKGKELDARSDLFSLGIVLFEVATGGRLPFPGDTTGEILESIFTREPQSASQLNSKIPPDLDRILSKALQKNPDARYQSAADLRSDLEDFRANKKIRRSSTSHLSLRSLSFVMLLLLTLIAGWYVARKSNFSTSRITSLLDRTPSIAVLPFVNIGGEKSDEYFSDGLAEEILNMLSQVNGLRVVARTSAFEFKGKNEDLRSVGKKLNAKAILEGSVRRSGNEVRITAQLISAENGYHIWSQTYDRELNDIFSVQQDIARSVSEALEVKLLTHAGAPPIKHETDAAAYTEYLQGRYFTERRTKEDLEKAIESLKRAIQIDPNYALAWDGLALAHVVQTSAGFVPPKEGYQMARDAAKKALQIDDHLAEAHSTVGIIHLWDDWNWEAAKKSMDRALELNPGSALVLRRAALLYFTLGPPERAVELTRHAVQLDPLSPGAYNNLGSMELAAGNFGEAEQAYKKSLELRPDNSVTRVALARTYLQQKRYQESLREFEKLPNDSPWRLYGKALLYPLIGKKEEGEAAFQKYIETRKDISTYQIAQIYAFRGDRENAFRWLDRSYELHDQGLAEIKFNSMFDPVSNDPRYHAFLNKMKLN